VLRHFRYARGHASRFAPPALFRRSSYGEDDVDGWSGRTKKRREGPFLHWLSLRNR